MKNGTKLLCVLLSLIMALSVFTVLPVGVSAADIEITPAGATSGTTGDCTWYISGTKLIISGSGRMGSYDNDNYAPWHDYYDSGRDSGITELVIENGVTIVSKFAFCGCYDLEKVTIGNSVTGIGISAFNGCEKLTSVTLPASVTVIANNAFYCCGSLSSVTILGSVTSIGAFAFYNCTNLSNINLHDSVTSIGNSAFDGCSSLSDIHIPESLSVIAYSTFSGCSNLTSVVIPDSVSMIDGAAFYGCTKLESVTLPESLTEISDHVFFNCPRLKSVTIPASVRYIYEKAFGYYEDKDFGTDMKVDGFTICGYEGSYDPDWGGYRDSAAQLYAEENGFAFVSLGSGDQPPVADPTEPEPIPIPPTEPEYPYTDMGDCTWSVDNEILTISGSGRMGNYNVEWPLPWPWRNYYFTEAVIEDGVTNIGRDAFYDRTELEKVTIGNTVMGIGSSAFNRCCNLTDITLPDSLEIIGSYAFYRCSELTNINIPDGVTDIGNNAFYGCTKLKSVTIPASVTNIDTKAFGYYEDDDYGLSRKIPGFTIYGDVNSEAQRYAKAYGFRFERATAMTGDANGDYMVNVLDVTEIQHSLASMNTTTDEDLTKYADVDHNDMLDSVDAFIILRYTADIKTPYDEAIGQIQD